MMMSPRPLSGLSSTYLAAGSEPNGVDPPPHNAVNELPLAETPNITPSEESKTAYVPTPVKLAT
jgi:hypothetical protein